MVTELRFAFARPIAPTRLIRLPVLALEFEADILDLDQLTSHQRSTSLIFASDRVSPLGVETVDQEHPWYRSNVRATHVHTLFCILLFGGCADRVIGGSDSTDEATTSSETELPATGRKPAQTSSEATTDTDESTTTNTDGTTTDGSTTDTDESTTDASDECAPCELVPGEPCGIDSVYFAAGNDQLSDATICQLTSISCCFTAGHQLILEAHASSGEVADQTQAIELTDRRGQRVKDFLSGQGVDPNQLQVISKGMLEASEPSDPADQRVDFLFQ